MKTYVNFEADVEGNVSSLKGKWQVEEDSSLINGAKVSTSILPIEKGFGQLFELLKQVNTSKCVTSKQCGLIMNILFNDMTFYFRVILTGGTDYHKKLLSIV